jgi:hypothetical protein
MENDNGKKRQVKVHNWVDKDDIKNMENLPQVKI